jgi:hypothetical protein
MLECGAMSSQEIQEEVALGYARPSLYNELEEVAGTRALTAAEVTKYKAIDEAARFVRHKAVYEAKRRRNQAIHEYEQKLGLTIPPESRREVASTGLFGRILGRLKS